MALISLKIQMVLPVILGSLVCVNDNSSRDYVKRLDTTSLERVYEVKN